MPRERSGYPAHAVVAYLDSHITLERKRQQGNYSIWQETLQLNGKRLMADDRRKIQSWRDGDVELVGLGKFDRLLVDYGMHLSDFDRWAEERYGSDLYVESAKVAA